MKTIPFDEFCEKYKPLQNPFREDAPHCGLVFETFGEEAAFIDDIKMRPRGGCFNRIITLMDDGSLQFGYDYVNRLGYIVLGVSYHPEVHGTSFTFGD